MKWEDKAALYPTLSQISVCSQSYNRVCCNGEQTPHFLIPVNILHKQMTAPDLVFFYPASFVYQPYGSAWVRLSISL